MGGLIFLPAVAAGVIMPEFIKLVRQGNIEKASRLSTMTLQALLSTVAFIALILTAVAPLVINTLLGAQYRDAAPLVIVCAWMFIPVAFASYMLELGIAVDRQRIFGYYTLTLALISVVGDLFVAAPFGALGAVIVKFAAVLAGCAVLVRMCWPEPALKTNIQGISWTKNAVSIAIPSAVLGLLLWMQADPILSGAVTAVVFLAWTFASKLIDLDRLLSLARTFKQ